MIVYIKSEIIKTQPGVEVKFLSQQVHALLQIARNVRDVGMCTCRGCLKLACFGLVQANINLIVVEIGAEG